MKTLTDYELALLVQEVEEYEMLQAPARLKDEILEKSQSMHTKTVRQITRASARMELAVYSLKTAAAVAMAVFLFAFVSQPALLAEIQQYDRYPNYGKELSLSDDRDWDSGGLQTPSRQISSILQEINNKMEGFLGGFYGK